MARPHKVVINFKPFPKQKEVLASTKRFRIMKCGRRGGKTHLAAYWIVKNALERPGKHWVICKVLQLAIDEFLPRFLEWLPEEFITSIDRRTGRIKVRVGNMRSEIACVSAEKPNNLRGRGLASAVIDEAAFVTPTLWDIYIRPTLADVQAPAMIISSPKMGWFVRQWEKSNRGEAGKDWEAFEWTIYDNPHISREEIEAIRLSTPPDIFASEYMGEVDATSGQVYANFDDINIVDPSDERFADYKKWPVVVGIDWGSRDDTGIAWISVAPDGRLFLGQEHSKNGLSVAKHCSIMEQANRGYEKLRNTDYVLSHDAFRDHKRSIDSIADEFKRHGIVCKRSTRDLHATINKVSSFISGSEGLPWLYVSKNCPRFLLEVQNWNWKDHEPDILQAFRYGLEEICRRRMTPFYDMASEQRGYNGVYTQFTNTQIDLSVPRLDPNKRKRPKNWRFEI